MGSAVVLIATDFSPQSCFSHFLTGVAPEDSPKKYATCTLLSQGLSRKPNPGLGPRRGPGKPLYSGALEGGLTESVPEVPGWL